MAEIWLAVKERNLGISNLKQNNSLRSAKHTTKCKSRAIGVKFASPEVNVRHLVFVDYTHQR